MYRFALRPWWIVSHLIVLALVISFLWLGFWQLRRLEVRQVANTQLQERVAEDPVDIGGLVTEGTDPDDVIDRRVTVTGTYRADEQVLIRGRSLDDSPGSWVVVPMEMADGRVVAVNRGWIRNNGIYEGVPDEFARVPEGELTIDGLILPAQERGSLGATDPAEGVLPSLARIDIDRLDQQVEGDLLPIWVQLTKAEPGAPAVSPTVLNMPELNDEGPHLSYAVQWFIFMTIAIGGYPLILRRAAQERGERHPDDAPGPDDPDPDAPGPDDPDPDDPDPDDVPTSGDPRLGSQVP